MSDIKITKVAASGNMAVYAVHIDDVKVLDTATMEEVMEFLMCR